MLAGNVMDPQTPIIPIIVGLGGLVFVMFVFAAIWASRYVKIGHNEVLIISGRQRQLPDGTWVGFRIVRGGGTFVWPTFERVDALSLEVMRVDMPKSTVRTANGNSAIDSFAQVKIKSDDASIVTAAEHFLSKAPDEIKSIIRPVLEKHLNLVVGSSSAEQLEGDPASYAARVETAVAPDLAKMGLSIVSFTIQNVRR